MTSPAPASAAGVERHLETTFRLPFPGFPRVRFVTDFGFRGGALLLGDRTLVEAATRLELEEGLRATVDDEHALSVRLAARHGRRPEVEMSLDGRPLAAEGAIRARPSLSAWVHAVVALVGSFAGFAASWLYLRKADLLADEWALKMGRHMAGWHLLLTLTLFPASVWGQAIGVRTVQGVSMIFFLIHAGIALANSSGVTDIGIAVLNAVSGAFFLVATLYGQRAHRDMSTDRALSDGRATVFAERERT